MLYFRRRLVVRKALGAGGPMPLILYVGDLSKADARLLVDVARASRRILEFGVGGSTMLFAQAMPRDGVFVSVDTDPGWIERTRSKLVLLKSAISPKFLVSHTPPAGLGPFDFVFVDGADPFRLSFAVAAWPLLAPGAAMGFHDTRRQGDVDNVQALVRANFEEVGDVLFNANDSNITLVRKRLKLARYENWHDVEGKERWASGYEVTPANWLELNPPTVEVL
jgi:predicted O-methyltransferase YrrM